MKKLKVLAGDLVRIPIDENGNFVVCRVISEENVNAHLVEVFSNVFSSQIKDVNNLELGDRLFRPVFLKFMFFDNQKWVLLKHDPNYCRTESDYENIKIAFDGAAPYELWQGGKLYPSSLDALVGLEPSIVWFPPKIVDRIVAHLAGKYGPSDVFPV